VLAAAGCAGITNPYVKPDGRPGGNVTLESAIGYANSAKDAYKEALGNQAELRSWLGIGLIPLGAATLGLGITGASPTAITVLGLTGAAAYGTGSWLQSPPQERAYIAGYNAINCAIGAVAPLNIDKNSEFARFDESMKIIDRHIADVQSQIGVVNAAISDLEPSAGSQDALVVRAKEEVTAARSIVDSAVAARANGTSLMLEVASAGSNLVTAVDRIVGQVDDAILLNQPDLQSLSSIIGGLGQAYSQFTAVPEGLRKAEDLAGAGVAVQTGRAGVLNMALQELQERVATLSIDTRRIVHFVSAVVAKKPIETLQRCGVDPDKFASDIAIDPAGPIEFAQGQASTKGFVVVGGRAPYTAQLLNDTAAGVAVRQPEPFGPAFLVQASAEAKAGEYSIYVVDAASHRKFVTAVVKAPPQQSQRQGQEAAADPIFTALGEVQRKRIQRALCVPDDGIWGTKTREALRKYQGEGATGVMTEALRDELLALDDAAVAERCGVAGGNGSLIQLADRLEDASFDLKGASLAVVGRPAIDQSGNIVGVTLSVDRRPVAAISEAELKQELVKTAAVAGATAANVQIVNLDEISDQLMP
jgi:hypothetical protein